MLLQLVEPMPVRLLLGKNGYSPVHESVSEYFTPNSNEQSAIDTLATEVNGDTPDDAVTIAYITDTHLDSYQLTLWTTDH